MEGCAGGVHDPEESVRPPRFCLFRFPMHQYQLLQAVVGHLLQRQAPGVGNFAAEPGKPKSIARRAVGASRAIAAVFCSTQRWKH
jgi:hypothetical protein